MNEELFLKGSSLKIYRFMLKNSKPLGIREIQRKLEFSSPSVVQYHLIKLECLGLVKKEKGNYTLKKVILEECIKIKHFLIPKQLFYSFFALFVLVCQFTVFISETPLHDNYLTFALIIFFIISCCETIRVWHNHNL